MTDLFGRPRRLVALLLALVGVLTATACAGPGADDGPPGGGPADARTDPADLEVLDTEIVVDDLRFRALEAGPHDGELVLLLHGFPQTSSAWASQLDALANAGYHAVAFDQRGYSPGARPTDDAAYAMAELSGDVLGVADALGAERFHLVGHDFGAIVAWNTAAAHPDRVRTLTSVSTPHPAALADARNDPTSDQADRSAYVDVFVRPGAEQLFVADDRATLRTLYAAAGMDEAEVEGSLATLGNADAMRAVLGWYRASALATATDTEPPGPSASSTLFIWGTADDALGPDAAHATGDHVDAPYRFEIVQGGGHWLPQRSAALVDELLVDFLGGAAPDAADRPVTLRATRDARYCELQLVPRDSAEPEVQVWASLGVNDCPPAAWEGIDLDAVSRQHDALVIPNGPRRWLSDQLVAHQVPDGAGTFGALALRLAATLTPDPPAGGREPFTPRRVERSTTFTWDASSEVYELVDPDGGRWVMQSYSLEVDPDLELSELVELAGRLDLPEGWTYRTRTLDEPLVLSTGAEGATVVQDDLRNTYQLASGPG